MPLPFILDAALATLHEARRDGVPALVIGPWGSGKTRLLHELAVSGVSTLWPGEEFDAGAPGGGLLVDDVDRVRPDAVATVARACRSGAAVVSVCTGHTVPEPIHRAWQDAGGVLVGLTPLGIDDVARLLAATGPAGTDDAEEVRRATAGVTRLVAEVVRARAGDRDRAYVTAPAASIGLVTGLRAAMTTGERGVFDVLAVAGELPVAVVERIAPDGGWDRLESTGIAMVRVANDESVASVHLPLVLQRGGERAVSVQERRRLVRELLAAWPADALPRRSLPALARAGQWAAEVDGDLDLVRRGLRAAILLTEPDVARRLGQHVLARDPSDLASAHQLAMAHEMAGDHLGAAEVASLVEASTADATWTSRTASNRYFADPTLGTAAAPDDAGDAEAQANVAWLQLFAGDVSAAAATAARVLDAPDATPQATVWAAVIHPAALVIMGGDASSSRSLEVAEAFVGRGEPSLNPFASLQVGLCRAFVALRTGRAASAYEQCVAALAADPHPLLAAAWHGFAALAAREAGGFATAAAHLDAALPVMLGDPFGLGTWAASERAVCAALTGDGDDAIDEGSTGPVGLFTPIVLRNHGWVAAAHGRLDEAMQRFREAADAAHAGRQTVHEILALVDLARTGAPAVAERALAGLHVVDNPLVAGGARIVRALADPRYATLHAAAEAAHALGWGVADDELAWAALARLRSRGELAPAAVLEVAWDPQRHRTPLSRIAPDPVLTVRERQLGRHAAAGATSQEIAATLGLSPRTVDNLLGRVYVKCGVRGRHQLAEATAASWWSRPAWSGWANT